MKVKSKYSWNVSICFEVKGYSYQTKYTYTFTFTWEVSTITFYFYLKYILLFYAYDPLPILGMLVVGFSSWV